jgi:salicylate hydroxylase
MTLKDGTVVHGDLVVGADGIHSISAVTVLGSSNPPQPAQHSNCCYRFLIPRVEVENDPETSFFTKSLVGMQGLRIWPDPENARRLVYYPCREYVTSLRRDETTSDNPADTP